MCRKPDKERSSSSPGCSILTALAFRVANFSLLAWLILNSVDKSMTSPGQYVAALLQCTEPEVTGVAEDLSADEEKGKWKEKQRMCNTSSK